MPEAHQPWAAAAGPDVLSAMQSAAAQLWSQGGFWHIGGLGWQRAAILDPASKVQLLTAGGGPSGWGWIEDGVHLNALVGRGDARGARELVGWFVEEAASGAAVTATVPEGARHLVRALLDAGFAPADEAPFSLDMRSDALPAPLPVLPSGFALRTLAPGEEAAFVACHRAAWNPHLLPWPAGRRPALPPDAASSFSESGFAQVRATWPYRQELVIVVEAPDGSLAASCIAWLDEANSAAEIEPLGVVPEHRGSGLGRAVCLGAVSAVGKHGCAEVTIHPRGDNGYPAPRRLYSSCGFRTVAKTLPFQRAAPRPGLVRG